MINVKPDAYLLRFGEMAIKGRNHERYVDDLVKILKPRLIAIGGKIEKQHKKLLIRCDAEPQHVRDALRFVFGIVSVSPIWRVKSNFDAIETKAWSLVEPFKGSQHTFAVRVKRVNKRFAMTSSEIARKLAQGLYNRGFDLPVDLNQPTLPLGVVIASDETWIFMETWPGLSGLPICEHARYGLLLSGGIDSPVAGNMIQQRGGQLEVIYFDTPPYTTDGAREKVQELAELLARYQNRLTLHTVNMTQAMQTIRATAASAYTVILSRRLMLQVSERLVDCQALVTGESLSQVASQTIENLAAVDHAARRPILRPLIGLDKQEIIHRAEALGSFAISKRPDQDCCSLFAPAKPITRAKLDDVLNEEAKFNLDHLIEASLQAVQTTQIIPDFTHTSK